MSPREAKLKLKKDHRGCQERLERWKRATGRKVGRI